MKWQDSSLSMENIVKALFRSNKKILLFSRSLTQLIWLRYEDAEEDSEVRESLQKLINLAGMHGFKLNAVELDDVI